MYKMRQTFVSKQTNKALGLKATKFEKVKRDPNRAGLFTENLPTDNKFYTKYQSC